MHKLHCQCVLHLELKHQETRKLILSPQAETCVCCFSNLASNPPNAAAGLFEVWQGFFYGQGQTLQQPVIRHYVIRQLDKHYALLLVFDNLVVVLVPEVWCPCWQALEITPCHKMSSHASLLGHGARGLMSCAFAPEHIF